MNQLFFIQMGKRKFHLLMV